MDIYLGIDSGTQSTKAVALELGTGRVLATARAPHRLIPGLPRHPEAPIENPSAGFESYSGSVDTGWTLGHG